MIKLCNTAYKLRVERALRVAYFGGSITEGGGDFGWRALTTQFLRDSYPEAEIAECNAAIGGTGTLLGVYRMDDDVLPQKPDLTFLEFALNDGATAPVEEVLRNTESIVRKLRRANPRMDIVVAFTTSKSIEELLARGEAHHGREANLMLARQYGLNVIDIATPLAEAVRAAGDDWLQYTADTVHPNKAGYARMGAAAAKAMADMLDATPAMRAHELPTPLSANLLEGARMADAYPLLDAHLQPDTSVESEWKRLYLTLCNRYPHTIGANRPGATLTYAFSGGGIGLYYMIASDSGDFEFSIDDAPWQSRRTWDHYALNFARAAFMKLADDLDGTKPHILRLRVAETKDERATGYWVRIAAFGVEA